MSLSAFPQIVTEYDESLHEYTNNVHSVGGMSLRDYFAAKAMQGIVSSTTTEYVHNNEPHIRLNAILAKLAYGIADEMMKARDE